ncbi:MAG: hypothetical protein AAGJ81_10800 [Verrucomicrobiota bacterium]
MDGSLDELEAEAKRRALLADSLRAKTETNNEARKVNGVISLIFGAILGYIFFLIAGFIPGSWVFLVSEEWRRVAAAGFARIAGASAFVFFSWMFGRGDKKRVLNWALWISISYFLLAEVFFLWAFYHELVPTVWFPLTMAICGITGSLIGYFVTNIVSASEMISNQKAEN